MSSSPRTPRGAGRSSSTWWPGWRTGGSPWSGCTPRACTTRPPCARSPRRPPRHCARSSGTAPTRRRPRHPVRLPAGRAGPGRPGPGAGGRDVEDLYPLTAMQSGMLYHSLADARRGLYLEQISFTVDGLDDPAMLEEAWRRAVADTPVLRTAVLTDGLSQPLQAVHRTAPLPVTHLDWRERTDPARRAADWSG
ncbi:condensation domain-containing protein [Streptomyces sp. S399]|uniref:condensation domain-containing protein n=1 Tax=Streptomyces sp. S399 TaxID=3096009 RepID=UPI002A820241|nr:condensation domain-containing protein [Streptomyces sp. S399]WPR51926.1 condensation domain-containing protein [Streptomyces sp. S399]